MSSAGHVTVVQHAGREIHLVGTAHISQRSVQEVERVIAEVRPDTVCVELDSLRHEALVDDSRWSKLDVFQVIREKKVLFLMTNLALSAYQRKMGERLGVKPGAELLAAVNAAREVGAELVLADRDVQATLKRTWANLSWWNKVKISAGLVTVPFSVEEISEEEIEALKDRDTISEMLEELARVVPGIKGPLIDERDQFLAGSITDAPGDKIVAVVGAGHIEGVLRQIGQPVDKAELVTLPRPARWVGLIKWLIPLLVLLAFSKGYYDHAGDALQEMLFAWVIPNSVLAALFSALAGAKPLTILTAFVASPITSLNPLIGAGMVAGLVEAWLRKPTVADCESVADDVLSVRGIYKNGFTRVLLVTVAATLGSAVGAWVGGVWLVTILT